jgi:hypothetical protein
MVVVVKLAAAEPTLVRPAAAPRPQTATGVLTLGDYTYTTNAVGQATITGFNKNYTGALAITNTLSGCPATSIGESAFSRCAGLTQITIPVGVASIGQQAFAQCPALTNLTIPASVTNVGFLAFENCGGLTSITIPAGVTSIGSGAFRNCRGVTSITILANVTSIEKPSVLWAGPIFDCIDLTNVTISAVVTNVAIYDFHGYDRLQTFTVDAANASFTNFDGVLFNEDQTKLILCPGGRTGTYAIPASVTSIEERAFSVCTGLTNITIPASVTSIGKQAFQDCTDLTSITIPASVTSIGESAFDGCAGLTNVTISAGVTSIEDEAFFLCIGLTGLTIPASVTNIGELAFFACTGLTNVIISGVSSIGQGAFYGCTNLASITIPANVTSIGGYAFLNCTGLKAVTVDQANARYSSQDGVLLDRGLTTLLLCPPGKTGDYAIPASVTSIGKRAFQDCADLTNVTIPDGLTNIGELAFYRCTGLASVTIPASVTSIGYDAFLDCTNLPASIRNLAPNLSSRRHPELPPMQRVFRGPTRAQIVKARRDRTSFGIPQRVQTVKNLPKPIQESQTNSIRQGQPPMPVPLTREQDEQRVKEGILPSQDKDGNKTKVQPKPEGDGKPAP